MSKASDEKQTVKDEAVIDRAEFLSILAELEGTEVEYKIRMAINRLRALVDKMNG